jgi:hypothetical protein
MRGRYIETHGPYETINGTPGLFAGDFLLPRHMGCDSNHIAINERVWASGGTSGTSARSDMGITNLHQHSKSNNESTENNRLVPSEERWQGGQRAFDHYRPWTEAHDLRERCGTS